MKADSFRLQKNKNDDLKVWSRRSLAAEGDDQVGTQLLLLQLLRSSSVHVCVCVSVCNTCMQLLGREEIIPTGAGLFVISQDSQCDVATEKEKEE